jgi:hypothetical protein
VLDVHCIMYVHCNLCLNFCVICMSIVNCVCLCSVCLTPMSEVLTHVVNNHPTMKKALSNASLRDFNT